MFSRRADVADPRQVYLSCVPARISGLHGTGRAAPGGRTDGRGKRRFCTGGVEVTPGAVIRYADGGASITVDLIHSWKRDEIAPPVMSNSSGPKDYVKNQIWALFNANPDVVKVVMVRGRGPFFLLTQTKDGCWFDMTGKQVIKSAEERK
jgi:hypothetical protein